MHTKTKNTELHQTMDVHETVNHQQQKHRLRTDSGVGEGLKCILLAPNLRLISKKEGKDQDSIQSSTTPDPKYQCESDNFTIRHHKREPRGQRFPNR